MLSECDCVQVFRDAKRGEINAANPEKSARERATLLSAAWRDCSLKDMAEYEKLSQVCISSVHCVNRGQSCLPFLCVACKGTSYVQGCIGSCMLACINFQTLSSKSDLCNSSRSICARKLQLLQLHH